MASLFDPYNRNGGLAVLPTQGAMPGTPQPIANPLQAQPATGGLFADPTALGIMGSYLMAAGAPTTDPGASARMLAGMGPALSAHRSREQQARDLAAHRRQQLALQRERMNRPINVAPGGTLIDPQTQEPIYTAPFKPTTPKRTSRKVAMEGGMVQDQESYDGGQTWQNVGEAYLRRDPWKPVTRVTPDGGVEMGFVDVRTLPGGQRQVAQGEAVETPEGVAIVEEQATEPTVIGVGQKAPTEAQRKNAGYYDRMVQSEAVLSRLDEQGTSAWGKFLENTPGGVGNYLQDEAYQQYDQARRAFINAVLRKESGAVISAEEFRNANKQYFPQPGDSEETILQKRQARQTEIESMRKAAGVPATSRPATSQGWSIRQVE